MILVFIESTFLIFFLYCYESQQVVSVNFCYVMTIGK